MTPVRYGVMGCFATPEQLLDAIRALRHRQDAPALEAYVPYAVEGLSEALGLKPSRIPLITLIGGVAGGIGGFLMQWYAAVVSFPVNIGGRPLNSWPMFIPVTFEMVILCAALAAVFGMLFANGLPRLYHPVFNVPGFNLASRDKYFLCIRAPRGRENAFDTERFFRELSQLGATQIDEVWT